MRIRTKLLLLLLAISVIPLLASGWRAYRSTEQLGITLASLGLGMYAEPAIAHLIEEPLHDWFGLEGTIVHTISFIIALTIITYLHVVFGEMVPKSLALPSSRSTSAGVKFCPHSPPNCQAPKPTTETVKSVRPNRRYFIMKSP